jgi:hypothetical protein
MECGLGLNDSNRMAAGCEWHHVTESAQIASQRGPRNDVFPNPRTLCMPLPGSTLANLKKPGCHTARAPGRDRHLLTHVSSIVPGSN